MAGPGLVQGMGDLDGDIGCGWAVAGRNRHKYCDPAVAIVPKGRYPLVDVQRKGVLGSRHAPALPLTATVVSSVVYGVYVDDRRYCREMETRLSWGGCTGPFTPAEVTDVMPLRMRTGHSISYCKTAPRMACPPTRSGFMDTMTSLASMSIRRLPRLRTRTSSRKPKTRMSRTP